MATLPRVADEELGTWFSAISKTTIAATQAKARKLILPCRNKPHSPVAAVTEGLAVGCTAAAQHGVGDAINRAAGAATDFEIACHF